MNETNLRPWTIPLLGLLVPGCLLCAWWLASAQGWLPAQRLPAPADVAIALWQLLNSGTLAGHLAISLQRVLIGFFLGTLLGLVLGAAMGVSTTLKAYLYPSFKALAYIPLLGWLPIMMLLLGIGEPLKFVLIAKSSLVPVAINTCRGIENVPAQYLDLARIYKLSRRQVLTRIILPAAFPSIWSGVRYGLTYSWLVLVVVELLASSEGLGFLMVNAQQLFQLDVVMATVLIIAIIGVSLDRLLQYIEKRLGQWRKSAF
ncbi:ABC transporter permease [Pseudomonas sp. D5002]|uniref:ABC transporter permease n=1 Tax=Pseudomonas sp. D5002 TaxID=2738818 RepID=UPI0015A178C1|nr:ABC transporter permease [Pseudomonas sp. D5002]NWB09102.1 ABC transporter permease [Pseudomonas sp. D5002]